MDELSRNMMRLKFPYFNAPKNRGIVYFDNAATTQKPETVINAITQFYTTDNSNIHRSIHRAGAHATQQYENTRKIVKNFISAKTSEEIVFTSGTTESINLVANSYVKPMLSPKDIILASPLEHHSNLLPWQMAAKDTGAILKMLPINTIDHLVNEVELSNLLQKHSPKIKFIAMHHISNVTGGWQNITAITQLAHKFNVPVLVDGAQAAAHIKVNVQKIDCDFYCFSGHKVFGPTGTGVLFGKGALLEKFIPYNSGGGVVEKVSTTETLFRAAPHNLEAGTPNIGGVIAMGEAINFIEEIGFKNIHQNELHLKEHLQRQLEKIPNIKIYHGHSASLSNNKHVPPIFSFNIDHIHHYDLSSLLAENNILTRSGDLCSQTFMKILGVEGCVRVSLCFYNTKSEIDQFILSLKKAINILTN